MFFHSLEDAHSWEHVNPEFVPVTFCPGHVTGSIVVMYKLAKAPKLVVAIPGPKKRRGRPPRAKANA